jgi:hypothetical protein
MIELFIILDRGAMPGFLPVKLNFYPTGKVNRGFDLFGKVFRNQTAISISHPK